MISLVASLVLAALLNPHQDSRTVLLAAAMVRHQEPVAKVGTRATVVEIYPIAWESRGEYLDASKDATTESSNSPVQDGDRFQIFRNGWNVGWFDVNRSASKPYGRSKKVVGLGGWSLPRRLYPYRLDRATNINYLYHSIYDWGNNQYENSLQPFLALNTDRISTSSTEFSPAQIKRDLYPVFQDNMRHILHQVAPSVLPSEIVLKTFKAYDFNGDRVPEVVGIYKLPNGNNKTLTVVATIEASAFIERYRAVNDSTNWDPFDVIDVDGDGYKELVLLGRGDNTVSFQVIHGNGGRMKKVFEGASFGTSSR